MITTLKKLFSLQALFWFAFIITLGISVPDLAYVLEAIIGNSIFAYAFAGIIEVIIFLLTVTVFKLKRTGKSHWYQRAPYYLIILVLCAFSYYLQTIYAHHFYQPTLLSGAQDVPGIEYLPYIGSVFPIFNIIFALMSEVIGRKHEMVVEKTAEQLRREVTEKIAVAKERQRLHDEMAKVVGREAESIIGTALTTARNVFARRQKKPGSLPQQPAPVQPTPGEPEEEGDITIQDTARHKVVINTLEKDSCVRIGNVIYWSLNRATKELGVTRKQLEKVTSDGSLSKRFYSTFPMKNGQDVLCVSSSMSSIKEIKRLIPTNPHITLLSPTLGQEESKESRIEHTS